MNKIIKNFHTFRPAFNLKSNALFDVEFIFELLEMFGGKGSVCVYF